MGLRGIVPGGLVSKLGPVGRVEWDVPGHHPALGQGRRRAQEGLGAAAIGQGLTLVHFSAEPEPFLWDKGYLGGVEGVIKAGVEGVIGV